MTSREVKEETMPYENPTEWYDQVLNYVGAVDAMTQQDEQIAWRRSENQYQPPTQQLQPPPYSMRSHDYIQGPK